MIEKDIFLNRIPKQNCQNFYQNFDYKNRME